MAGIDEITHVVVLMLENHSFDHLLGFLPPGDPGETIDGLTGNEAVPLDPQAAPTDLVSVARATLRRATVTDPDPGHEFADVTLQLFGQRTVPAPPVPLNNGFVGSYAGRPGDDGRPVGATGGRTIMQCLDPNLVPVLSALARNFVVCDRWFASVPGPTWPNRLFVHAATSGGLADSPTPAQVLASQAPGGGFAMRTIYESLMDHGRTWKIYFDDHAQAFALRNLHRHLDRFHRFETFAADVAAGTLADYSFIEPQYFSALGNPATDQHPPHRLEDGERLIAAVYDTLRSNEAVWRRALLVVLYDEHGGFYDHVPPPAAVRPDDLESPTTGFRFDRLGVRVPAVLVSPWVGRGKVAHATFDHTSLLATVKKIFGLPDFLTRRDAAANTFEDQLLTEARKTEDTPATLSALVRRPRGRSAPDERGLSDHQRALVALSMALDAPQSEHHAALEVTARTGRLLAGPQAP